MSESSEWREMGDHSEEFARYLEIVTPLLDVMKRKIIDMLRLRPGASAFDVGCGLGRDTEVILDEVGSAGRVVGIDAAKELIATAIERTRATAPRREFRVGDALALEFPDSTFDACRADRVLQHLQDPGRRLVQLLLEANCTDVTVDAEVLLFRELGIADFVLHIRSTLETAMATKKSRGMLVRHGGRPYGN